MKILTSQTRTADQNCNLPRDLDARGNHTSTTPNRDRGKPLWVLILKYVRQKQTRIADRTTRQQVRREPIDFGILPSSQRRLGILSDGVYVVVDINEALIQSSTPQRKSRIAISRLRMLPDPLAHVVYFALRCKLTLSRGRIV